MVTKEPCKYYEAFTIQKKIAVRKPSVPDRLNTTTQNANAGLEKCFYPEEFRKEVLSSCWETSQRWKKAFEDITDNNLDAPQKTIMKGIISDIFTIPDPKKRKTFVDRELGTNRFTMDAKRGSTREKTVYELYFQDKTIEEFELKKKTLGIIGNGYPGVGAFTRSTVNRWYNGTLPNDRNKVIRLAFWAKCTIEETNKLLESAGMHKLYLKSTGGNNLTNAKNSLQDLVYIFLLKHENYSFAKSQEITDELDQLLKKVKREEIAGTGREKTKTLLDELMKLKECDDNFVSNDFISYFNKHLSDLLSSYRTLYGSVVDGFIKKYDACRGNTDDQLQNSISTLTSCRLKCPQMAELKKESERNNESNEWRESLINTLYAAYFAKSDVLNNNEDTDNVKKKKKKKNEEKKEEKVIAMERVFSRNDVIILGLILNKSMKEINDSFLASAQEPPLYGRNFIENVIRKATSDPACKVCADVIASRFTSEYQDYYDITKEEFTAALNSLMFFYDNRKQKDDTGNNPPGYKYENQLLWFVDIINALRSLEKYEWIKSISIVKEIYPSKAYDILFFKHLTEIEGKNLEEKLADIHGPVITPKPDPETKGRQNLFVIHVLGKEKAEKAEKNNAKKKGKKADEKKETNIRKTTIYLKKLKVVRPAAYHLSKKLLAWYPEKVMFDFLVYKTSVNLKKEKYRKYLLPEERLRFVKGDKIQYELPLHL